MRNRLVETEHFGRRSLPLDAFMTSGNVLTFGIAPSRVDLLNEIDGVTFDEARPNAVRGRYGNVDVTFIGLADLVKNKKAYSQAEEIKMTQEFNVVIERDFPAAFTHCLTWRQLATAAGRAKGDSR